MRVSTNMKRKILIADDDEYLRRLVEATLAGEEFEITHAVNGEETILLAHLEQPDLILLDIMMPKVDGYAVCHILKSDPLTSKIKIVMLTVKSSAADKELAEQAGADDYFSKPFSPTALLNRVHDILS
ncbi:MAG: response regulator [Chloroflexi bacterium]|nr:response regulator [Chloroflexota bacterium]MCL5076195.1 response regulator [Chloroflexota bacterium]